MKKIVLICLAQLFVIAACDKKATVIDPEDLKAQAIYQSQWNTCRVLDNSAECWGDNVYGQLGLRYPQGSNRRIKLPFTQPILQMDFGYFHGCLISLSSQVYCWGRNIEGQVNPTSIEKVILEPQLALKEKVFQVATTGYYSCAILKSGALKCWGQLPDFLAKEESLEKFGDIAEIDSSSQQLCFKNKLGEFYCKDSKQSPEAFRKIDIPLDSNGIITLGETHACALSLGNVYCWGQNDFGQLGNGSFYSSVSTEASQVKNLPHMELIIAGGLHTCGLAMGEVYCWGANSLSQSNPLDKASRPENLSIPVKIADFGQIRTLSAGYSSTCALNFKGYYSCWGTSTNGL